MKRQIRTLAAALGLCLLLTAGSASAQPMELCYEDGQYGWSYGHENGRYGWHVWTCYAYEWHYTTYCGTSVCLPH